MTKLNPYSDQNFFEFFVTFVKRFWYLLVHSETLASDEIQMFVLIGVALSGAMVGTFLVLRQMTMLANALSHTILIGIIGVYLLLNWLTPTVNPFDILTMPILLLTACLTGLVTTFLTEFLSRVVKLQTDASIGLVFTILFAVGLVLVSVFTRNSHIGTELVMGNVDGLQLQDLSLVLGVAFINCVLFCLFFRAYKITTFDPLLARIFGFSSVLFNYVLMVQTAATTVASFNAVGLLMILAFFVLPTLTARLFVNNLLSLLFLAIAIGIIASILGVAFSRHWLTIYGTGISTGGIVVIFLGLFYFSALLFTPSKGFVNLFLYRRIAQSKKVLEDKLT